MEKEITSKQPAAPPHGGSWRQNPDTGELVLITGNEEASEKEADKEKK